MKRLVNNPEDIVEELIEGYTKAFDDVKVSELSGRVIARKNIDKDKVGIIIGGGSGHEPLFLGYVGEGFADACVIGHINTSPDPYAVYNAIKEVGSNKGVLLMYGNYTGDVLNFDMAQDMAIAEGYKVKSIQVTDDVVSAEDKDGRRGIAGDIFVMKIAASAADLGYEFDEVYELAQKANDLTASMGVALGAADDPRTGHEMFNLEQGQMEIGMGIHGEPGVRRGKIETLNEVVDEITDPLIKELDLKENDEVGVLINGLGATPYMDLFVMNKKLSEILEEKKIKVNRTFIGTCASTMNMPGQSITLIKLDEELKKLLNQPCDAPYFKIK